MLMSENNPQPNPRQASELHRRVMTKLVFTYLSVCPRSCTAVDVGSNSNDSYQQRQWEQ